MASKILNIPKSIEGCVVECGSYKGASTTNLSLICVICNRKLEVFDSFEGLPQPSEQDKAHTVVHTLKVPTYSKGDYYGSLEEVKGNISRYGDIRVCNFNVGYFDDTLPKFKKKCAFIYLDVDLRDSLETCLRHLWPLLQDGCCLFTHEALHMEIASLFFDKEWWRNNLNCYPPGLIGAGSGLGLIPESGGFTSAIGYTVKNPQILNFKEEPQTGIKKCQEPETKENNS
ncbi:MAG: TylF/MycF/NovP-related O-methyltransferase [Candidatus Lokiarchaeia archaeon]